MVMKVLYSCHECGIEKAPVEVPERKTEDVQVWIEQIMAKHIAADHYKRSPLCPSQHADIMIPISGAEKIGGASVQ